MRKKLLFSVGRELSEKKIASLSEKKLDGLVRQKVRAIRETMRRFVLPHWLNLGRALVRRKEQLGHGKWLPWLKSVNLNQRTAQLYIQTARMPREQMRNVTHLSLRGARELVTVRKAEPEPTRQTTVEVTRLPDVVRKPVNIEYTKIPPDLPIKRLQLFTSETDKWNTPKTILRAVQEVLGKIELDPCFNAKGKANVPAERHFTEEDDGLKQEWKARSVYMNPPYGDEIKHWVKQLVDSYKSGAVKEAIALVPRAPILTGCNCCSILVCRSASCTDACISPRPRVERPFLRRCSTWAGIRQGSSRCLNLWEKSGCARHCSIETTGG